MFVLYFCMQQQLRVFVFLVLNGHYHGGVWSEHGLGVCMMGNTAMRFQSVLATTPPAGCMWWLSLGLAGWQVAGV